MSQTTLPRESVEYLEILTDVFAGLVRKSVAPRESNGNGDVTRSLEQCLEYVYLHGPSPIRKIALGLSITVPAASQLVDRLVQKNLVTREHSEEDRRLARVDLTKAGAAVVTDCRSARLAWTRSILERMTDKHREILVDALEEFIEVALDTSGQAEDACAHCGIDHLAFCVVNRAHVASTGEPLERF